MKFGMALILLLTSGLFAAEEPENLAVILQAGARVRTVAGGIEVSFHLGDRQVSADVLSRVADLPNVVTLNLKRTNINNNDLRHISQMHSLKKLHLELTKIDDRAIRYLSGLKKLQYLNLFGTSVSDVGLKELHSNRGLTHLYVWQSKITSEGIREIQLHLPELKVVAGVDLDTIQVPDPNVPEKKPTSMLKFVASSTLSDAPQSRGGENIEVIFANKTEKTVKIVWIGYDGKPKVYGQIAAGASRTQNSYENNTWLITTLDDKPLGYFVCGPVRALAVISD